MKFDNLPIYELNAIQKEINGLNFELLLQAQVQSLLFHPAFVNFESCQSGNNLQRLIQ